MIKPTKFSRAARLGACLLLMGLFVALPNAAAAADAEFTIEARDFDGGNVRVSLTGQPYADGPSCIWNAGELPNWAEYEIEFPVTGQYTLSALYAAAQARPVEIRLDDKPVHVGFTGTTGNWNTSSARWEEQCVLRITRGTHTIALRVRHRHWGQTWDSGFKASAWSIEAKCLVTSRFDLAARFPRAIRSDALSGCVHPNRGDHLRGVAVVQ